MDVVDIFGVQMRKRKSVLAKLWDWITSLVAIAVLGGIAWYAYSLWDPTPPSVSDSEQGPRFNCKRAFAERESDYACVASESCTMSPDELAEMENREADIDQNCNLGFNPLADAIL